MLIYPTYTRAWKRNEHVSREADMARRVEPAKGTRGQAGEQPTMCDARGLPGE